MTEHEDTYVIWSPIDNVPPILCVKSLRDVPSLLLTLRGEGTPEPLLQMSFSEVVGYRNVNESYRMKTWNRMARLGTRPSSLFMVNNSTWLTWLIEESAGILEYREGLRHFAIYTPDDCIDVACYRDPEVRWIPGLAA